MPKSKMRRLMGLQYGGQRRSPAIDMNFGAAVITYIKYRASR